MKIDTIGCTSRQRRMVSDMDIVISPEILAEFKDRMRLGDDEDKNLIRILKASVEDLHTKCGDYNVYTNERFKELVFERSRYAYNDALEYFNDNFLSQILSLSLEKALSTLEGEIDATIQVRTESKFGEFEK